MSYTKLVASMSLAAGMLGLIAGCGSAAQTSDAVYTTATRAVSQQPPPGARAVVQVTPNPTTRRGEPVRITGNCAGGERLKGVFSSAGGGPQALKNVRIVKDDPNGFEATATLSPTIGNGVGVIFVDCGTEAGVTLLVTHV